MITVFGRRELMVAFRQERLFRMRSAGGGGHPLCRPGRGMRSNG